MKPEDKYAIIIKVNNEEEKVLFDLAKRIAAQKYITLSKYVRQALSEKLQREK